MTMWSEALAVKPPQRYPIFSAWGRTVTACDNESQLPSAPPTEQGESFHCAQALEESTKTVAKSYAWAELVHPLLHQRHKQSGGWAGFPLLPLQLLALKIFQIFNCKVRGFKVWSLRQREQFFMWMAKSTLGIKAQVL